MVNRHFSVSEPKYMENKKNAYVCLFDDIYRYVYWVGVESLCSWWNGRDFTRTGSGDEERVSTETNHQWEPSGVLSVSHTQKSPHCSLLLSGIYLWFIIYGLF